MIYYACPFCNYEITDINMGFCAFKPPYYLNKWLFKCIKCDNSSEKHSTNIYVNEFDYIDHEPLTLKTFRNFYYFKNDKGILYD